MSTKKEYVFDKKNALTILIAFVVLILIFKIPAPSPIIKGGETILLTHEGKAVFAALMFAVILWLTEAIPFAATSISLFIIIHFMGVATFGELVKAGMGNTVLLFLIGAMGITAALTNSGLSRRLVLMVISRVGNNPKTLVLAFIVVGSLISMWVTDMAVAAMMLPLGVSILRDAGCVKLKSNFGKALMISCVYGPLIGGVATPAGNGGNILAMQFIQDIAGLSVTFLQWMIVGVPCAILMIPVGYFLLIKFFPPEMEKLPFEKNQIKEQLHDMGPLTRKEINTMIVFVTVVILWVFGPFMEGIGFTLPAAGVSLLGFFLLFLPGLRVFDSWSEAEKEISWSGIMLIAGGIAAGLMLAETGAARYIAWGMLSGLQSIHPIGRVLLVVCMVEVLKIFFSSNSVTGAVIMPLVITLAIDLNMSPWAIAGPAGIATSMAFIMVTSSPTNVIPYAAGYFTIKDFAKVGVLMTVAGILIVTFAAAVFGNLAGMNIWNA